MTKPNLLYYFPRKEEIYVAVLEDTLDEWLQPLRELDPAGDPIAEIGRYIDAKLEMSRTPAGSLAALRQRDPAGRAGDRRFPARAAEGAGRREGGGHRGLDRGGPARAGRSVSPHLHDLGDDPALRRFRRAGPGGARRETAESHPAESAGATIAAVFFDGLRPRA